MFPLLNLSVKVILFMTFFHGFRSGYLTVSKQVVYVCHHLQLRTSSLSTSLFEFYEVDSYLMKRNESVKFTTPLPHTHLSHHSLLQGTNDVSLCDRTLLCMALKGMALILQHLNKLCGGVEGRCGSFQNKSGTW